MDSFHFQLRPFKFIITEVNLSVWNSHHTHSSVTHLKQLTLIWGSLLKFQISCRHITFSGSQSPFRCSLESQWDQHTTQQPGIHSVHSGESIHSGSKSCILNLQGLIRFLLLTLGWIGWGTFQRWVQQLQVWYNHERYDQSAGSWNTASGPVIHFSHHLCYHSSINATGFLQTHMFILNNRLFAPQALNEDLSAMP